MTARTTTMDPKESTIRLMTRLALQHDAVNLSQGFTDEAPPFELVWGGIAAILGGTDEHIDYLERSTVRQVGEATSSPPDDVLTMRIKDLLARLQNPRDRFNQYSFPFGLPELRQAIAAYTERFRGFRPDPETEITVVLGATEGLAVALRAVCQPNDGVIIAQPFHEMYPSQARLFGLRPLYVTLREDPAAGQWRLDEAELAKAAARGARVLVLNTPHNPTGKVFTRDELSAIASICQAHDLLVVTDEIYEHILYVDRPHHCLADFEGMRDRTLVVNSISKTGSATGWRVGWILSPPAFTAALRGIHDTLAIQAPTPLQKGAGRLLALGDEFYREMRTGYRDKRDVLMAGLAQAGFHTTPPEGAYYLFADYRRVPALDGLSPMEASMFLIERAGVAPVPGDNFYAAAPAGAARGDRDRYLRFAFCRSVDTLREAARRLATLGAAAPSSAEPRG